MIVMTTDDRKVILTECWYCVYSREIPNNAHIQCINPDQRMDGEEHGKRHGWFNYPLCFDPVWKIKKCCNYEPLDKKHPF